jgi:hypothetical protein
MPATRRQRCSGHSFQPKVRRSVTAIGVGAAAVAVVFTAVYLLAHRPSRHTTSTPPTPALPLIAGAQLDPLLLDAGDVNTIMGTTDMQPYGPINHELVPPPGPASACQSTTTITDPSLYPGAPPVSWSSWHDTAAQGGELHALGEAVVSMSSAGAALAAVQNAATQWQACSGQLITASEGTTTVQDSVGTVGGGPPKIWVLLTRAPADGWTCQHALEAVSNVVINVGACGYSITDQAVHAADVIAAKATQ